MTVVMAAVVVAENSNGWLFGSVGRFDAGGHCLSLNALAEALALDRRSGYVEVPP
jgi:hypothetical protein